MSNSVKYDFQIASDPKGITISMVNKNNAQLSPADVMPMIFIPEADATPEKMLQTTSAAIVSWYLTLLNASEPTVMGQVSQIDENNKPTRLSFRVK